MVSWPSPSLPKLQSGDSAIGTNISDEEGSWEVSSLLLASLPGAFLASWSVDLLGRKKTLLLMAVLSLIGWLLLAFANSLEILIAAGSIGGISTGMSTPAFVIYAAETSEEDIGGKVGTYLMLFKTFGTIVVLVVGPYVSLTALGLICASTPVLFTSSFIFMPESPFNYVKIGNEEEARKSLVRLSKKTADDKFITDRLEFIRHTVEEDMKNKGNYLELLTKKKYRFTIFLLFGVKSLQQFNGNAALEAYIQPIIEASDSGIEPEIASIIVGCIQLPTAYLSGILVDKLGRKILLLISVAGCCVALFGEGTYFYIKDYQGKDTSQIGRLPTVGLALFWISNPLGMLTLPYVLLGELFPTNIEGAAVSLATLYGGLTSFLVSKFFKPLSKAIGIYGVFCIFAGICMAGVLFVSFVLPETKGKNFQEIQEIVRGKKKGRKKSKDAVRSD